MRPSSTDMFVTKAVVNGKSLAWEQRHAEVEGAVGKALNKAECSALKVDKGSGAPGYGYRAVPGRSTACYLCLQVFWSGTLFHVDDLPWNVYCELLIINRMPSVPAGVLGWHTFPC
jgi:hypothetical protein